VARRKKKGRRPRKQKPCQLCNAGIEYIDYKDLATLKPYLNDRGRIKARRQSGACAKCQARLSDAIKTAREMALIPYSGH
jgi:small subunit ribosomal protein S18